MISPPERGSAVKFKDPKPRKNKYCGRPRAYRVWDTYFDNDKIWLVKSITDNRAELYRHVGAGKKRKRIKCSAPYHWLRMASPLEALAVIE